MVTPDRRGNTLTLLPNGKILAVAGRKYGLNQTVSSCELYDPATNSWNSAGALRLARWDHSATRLPNGKILIVGGSTWSNKQGGYVVGTASCECYDAVQKRSVATGSLHQARSGHAAVLLSNGQVLVVGGNSNAGPPYFSPSCELYDPSTGQWSMTGALSQGRIHHEATLLPNGEVLVTGGERVGEVLDGCEIYNPMTGQWRQATAMHWARAAHTATRLADGRVLVAGGYETYFVDAIYEHQRAMGSCDIYDPEADTWTATGMLISERNMHAASLLADGRVLVSGGFFLDSSYAGSAIEHLASCEIYDLATGNWSATASMGIAREGHCAAVLSTGEVLVTCGTNATPSGTPTSEVYQP
jgi:N-acetylneuraminic acid mutarotase